MTNSNSQSDLNYEPQPDPTQDDNFQASVEPSLASHNTSIGRYLSLILIPSLLLPTAIAAGFGFHTLRQKTTKNLAPAIQLIDLNQKQVINTLPSPENNNSQIIGGEAIPVVGQTLKKVSISEQITVEELVKILPPQIKLQDLKLDLQSSTNTPKIDLDFVYNNKQYSLTLIPQSDLLLSSSSSLATATGAKQWLPGAIALIVAAVLAAIVPRVLTRKITAPLQDLAYQAESSATGNLAAVTSQSEFQEIQAIGNGFNHLVAKIQGILQEQNQSFQQLETARQKSELLAQEQIDKNQNIQLELLKLLDDVEGASSGDLTVRSQINEGEIGIVADFFNSIIENLRDIVAGVKQATGKVNSSVDNNRGAVEQLTQEARQQAEQITSTLTSVEQMTRSIQQVADNAQEAAKVARIASSKAETGGESIDRTVSSIVQLRNTIDETATKVQQLGGASQQISRVISLINQIAMQTNLLAINASIEAARAGDEGRGFAVVAEEVGALATQSANATKEVESIVATIQQGIFQVVEVMQVGTTQAEEGTRLVEDSKKGLEQIMEVSQQIDSLVQAISQTTVSQAKTSEIVTKLMEQIAEVSEQTANTSHEVSCSLEATVAIAKTLQSSVDTFKVEQVS